MDKTADVLFQYLKNGLYHPEMASLDIDSLPEDFRKLGMGLQLVVSWIDETNDFFRSLARGELSKEPPGVDNIIAAPLKELQNSLRHLTWQTQQIAKGDFSQRVDFMGEFSEAFNTMTAQLAEHSESLLQSKQRVDAMNAELRKNLDLMLSLANYTHNIIYVVSGKPLQKSFRNRTAQWFEMIKPKEADHLWAALSGYSFSSGRETGNWDLQLPGTDHEPGGYYRIESYQIQWGGIPAIVHMVTDSTEQKKQEDMVHRMAYVDALTGLHNRRHADEKMAALCEAGKPFTLTIVDVDYLKYCNDTFGHEMGDDYLKHVAVLLKTKHGGDVCRVGGDEFFIIEEAGDPVQHEKELMALRTLYMEDTKAPYPHSFSFATRLIPAGSENSMAEHMREIDRMMYDFKKMNRPPLPDLTYRDDRKV
ncbi:MAG: diguanylate cyclase [Lachnospiraceae bacterium]|nr:diguanylate cyclase [Lachnospiraceae bacterium]